MTNLMTRTVAAAVICALLASTAVVVATATLAHAAVPIVVDTVVDSSPSAARCTDATAGNCSLRDALAQAGVSPGADTVQVPAGTYVLDAVSPICQLAVGVEPVSIVGVGGDPVIEPGPACSAQSLIVAATLSLTHLVVRNGPAGGVAASGSVTLDHVTITGNQVSDPGSTGAGIFAGAVTAFDSVISDNHLVGADSSGGGIAAGAVELTRTTVSDNSATGRGGGMDVGGPVTLTESTVTGNTSGTSAGGVFAAQVSVDSSVVSGNTAGFGGGITLAGNSAHASTITASTVSDNTILNPLPGYEAAGVALGVSSVPQLEVSRSTISGGVGGAGIKGPNWSVLLENSTVTGNDGGGVRTVGNGLVKLRYATVADNGTLNVEAQTLDAFASVVVGAGATGCAVQGTSTQGFNFEFGGATCLWDDVSDVVDGPDPALAALEGNGTAPATRRPQPGSPLVDAVDVANCAAGGSTLDVDERGEARPAGAGCDVGAHEAQPGAVSGVVRDLPAPKGTGSPYPAGIVRVKACPAATPSCTAAGGAPVTSAAPTGEYSFSGLYGDYVLTPYHCPGFCDVDAPATPAGAPVPVTVGESPVSADVSVGVRPDVQARTSSSPVFSGANVYSPGAPVVTRSAPVRSGASVTFVVKLENDGNLPEQVRLRAASAGFKGFSVSYLEGTTPVPGLAGPTGRTYHLAPGASVSVRVVMKASATSRVGQWMIAVLTATSLGESLGAKTDTLRVKAIRF